MSPRAAAGAFVSVAVATSCAAIAGLEDPLPIDAANEGGLPGTAGGDAGAVDGNGVSDDGTVTVLTNDAGNDAGTCNEPGLIAHWPLQEGAGTRVFDCTTGAHHGDFVNGPTWAAGHRAGRHAVSFDGTTGMEIDVADKPDLQLTGAMSISVWAYVRSASTDGRFLSKGGDVPDRGWDVKLEANDGSLELRIANDGSNQTSLFAAAFPLNGWKHVVAVYVPGGTMRLYSDGVKVAERTGGPATQYNSPDHVVIGARTGCCTLDGMLDDLRLYGKALTDAEVTALYGSTR